MNKKIICLIFVLILINISYSLKITEIMFDPIGSDTDKEWIEIYNDENITINLTEYKLFEANANHGLTLINGSFLLNSDNYAIISQNSNVFLQENLNFNSTLFKAVFSLSNNGENISIKDNLGNILTSVFYNASIGSKGNGNTLSLINDSWIENVKTPGNKNILQVQNNSIVLNSIKITQYLSFAILNKNYTSAFKIINNADGKYYNITLNYSVYKNNIFEYNNTFFKESVNSYSYSNTANLNFNTTENYTICGQINEYTFKKDNFTCYYSLLNNTNNISNFCNDNISDNLVCFDIIPIDPKTIMCNFSLLIKPTKLIYINEPVKFTFELNYTNSVCDDLYDINYLIYSNFETNKLIHKNYTTASLSEKTFTPLISDIDRIFTIFAKIITSANDSNLNDNYQNKTIIYYTNTSLGDNVNIKIGTKNGLIFYDLVNKTIDDDYYRINTNDIGIFLNGSTNDDYIDIYVKKSTRYQSNKQHLNLAQNSYFEITSFVNLDYLCYESNIEYFYSENSKYSHKNTLSKYFYFYDEDDEIINLTMFIENDYIKIAKNFSLNTKEFCYIKYSNKTIDNINQNIPLFESSTYYNSICKTSSSASNSNVCKPALNKINNSLDFDVVSTHHNEIITYNIKSIPVKIELQNKQYNSIKFDFKFKKNLRIEYPLKINFAKICDDKNYCFNLCSDKNICIIPLEFYKKYFIYFDVDFTTINISSLTSSIYTIKLNYIKDDQKTPHKLDLPVILDLYNSSNIIDDDKNLTKSLNKLKQVKDLIKKQNESDIITGDFIKDVHEENDSKDIIIFQEAGRNLKNNVVEYTLSGLGLSIFVLKLLKFL